MKIAGLLSNVWTRILSCTLLSVLAIGLMTVSESNQDFEQFAMDTYEFKGNRNTQKHIFVFLDGTKNTRKSETNVRRLFELIQKQNDPQITAIYIEGVGSVFEAPLTGPALGRGMEKRIIKAYNFIAENYSIGDNIYLFGFSRGAHQARSLAGLISYGGVLEISGIRKEQREKVINGLIELIKKKSDDSYIAQWRSWEPGQSPLISLEIRDKLDVDAKTAEIAFLGVWDTVPGSSLKDFGVCKEHKGFIKRHLYWMVPGIDKGERYKTDTYPPIRNVAHAVSIDEKRSKFTPLLICKAIKPQYSTVIEVWFPGAHADVGGGYEESEELPGISLEWMIGEINKTDIKITKPELKGDAKGLAHWSIGDAPANIGSECVDRRPSTDAVIHASFEKRKEASPVPVLWQGKERLFNYPIDCVAAEGKK